MDSKRVPIPKSLVVVGVLGTVKESDFPKFKADFEEFCGNTPVPLTGPHQGWPPVKSDAVLQCGVTKCTVGKGGAGEEDLDDVVVVVAKGWMTCPSLCGMVVRFIRMVRHRVWGEETSRRQESPVRSQKPVQELRLEEAVPRPPEHEFLDLRLLLVNHESKVYVRKSGSTAHDMRIIEFELSRVGRGTSSAESNDIDDERTGISEKIQLTSIQYRFGFGWRRNCEDVRLMEGIQDLYRGVGLSDIKQIARDLTKREENMAGTSPSAFVKTVVIST
ncbi:hypothetical protein BD410DRAFT_857584 [Rickenella mellea]|uniref:Uncharacterized protein n=1 Tax=Rickenella mellea TaxID=50990 RepID=A0A4Y7Q8C6_9AGAM|nr:hypothetical protein BD410DRAFT_857584 [Rickenella mellea]